MPFPIEKASTRKVMNLDDGVEISELLGYPVRGLVFEGLCSLEDLSTAVSDACICLQNSNIPYNVLISDSGRRVFLLPQVHIVTTSDFILCSVINLFCYFLYFILNSANLSVHCIISSVMLRDRLLAK